MKIEPMTSVPALEPGQMTVAWLIESGHPAEPVTYSGGPQIPGRIRSGIQLSLEEGGRIVTRTLDAEAAQVLRDALDSHIRNITPNRVRPPEAPRTPTAAWPPNDKPPAIEIFRGYRRLRDNPQA